MGEKRQFDNILGEIRRMRGTPKAGFEHSENVLSDFAEGVVWNPRIYYSTEGEETDIWWLSFISEIREDGRIYFAQSDNGAELYFFKENDSNAANPEVFTVSSSERTNERSLGSFLEFLSKLEIEETK